MLWFPATVCNFMQFHAISCNFPKFRQNHFSRLIMPIKRENAYLSAKIGFDTAANELSKVGCAASYQLYLYLLSRTQPLYIKLTSFVEMGELRTNRRTRRFRKTSPPHTPALPAAAAPAWTSRRVVAAHRNCTFQSHFCVLVIQLISSPFRRKNEMNEHEQEKISWYDEIVQ